MAILVAAEHPPVVEVVAGRRDLPPKRDFFNDNLLVQIHFIERVRQREGRGRERVCVSECERVREREGGRERPRNPRRWGCTPHPRGGRFPSRRRRHPTPGASSSRGTRSWFENSYFTEMCSGSEAGSYLRLIDFFVSLNSRLESNKEEEIEGIVGPKERPVRWTPAPGRKVDVRLFPFPGSRVCACVPQEFPFPGSPLLRDTHTRHDHDRHLLLHAPPQ